VSGRRELRIREEATTEVARTLSEAMTKWFRELSTREGILSGGGSGRRAAALMECSWARRRVRQWSCFGMLLDATWR